MSISSVETAGKAIVPVGEIVKKNQGWHRFKHYYLGPIIAFIVFITLWEIIPSMLGLKHFIFPKPSDVYKAAIEDWSILTAAIQITVVESLIGFAVSAVIGILLSVLLASSKIMERSIYPYAIILQTIPVVAVAPIVVIWFGAGYKSIIVISFLIGFFPIISNTLMGLNSVDKNMDELFTLY
ncbi:ABC transporter permease, partial [Paenibacillus sp. MCAF20]